jgi:hypothetical protein
VGFGCSDGDSYAGHSDTAIAFEWLGWRRLDDLRDVLVIVVEYSRLAARQYRHRCHVHACLPACLPTCSPAFSSLLSLSDLCVSLYVEIYPDPLMSDRPTSECMILYRSPHWSGAGHRDGFVAGMDAPVILCLSALLLACLPAAILWDLVCGASERPQAGRRKSSTSL